MNHWQKKGYDAWIELWARGGCSPSASMCPARYMPDGVNRSDFISGWNQARIDNSK